MKNLVSAVLIYTLTITTSFAGIKEDVNELGMLAMGSEVATVQGKTAKELFLNFAEKEFGTEAEEIGDELVGLDMIDNGLGFISADSAKAFGSFAEDFYRLEYEGSDDQEAIEQMEGYVEDLNQYWAPAITRLAKSGAKFAYSAYGPGYCGISFTQLHVIDVKGKKVYTIALSKSGSC